VNQENKVFKVLAIDGGGIKGLYSATILRHFEEKFGSPISDYFDLLCGTSTGGLIALAASLRISMKDICSFYENEGPIIFPEFKKNYLLSGIFRRKLTKGDVRQIARNGKFSDKPLKIALKKIFGDKLLGESNNYLCIPSYTITEAKPWVFKKDHHTLDRDDKTPYVDVALATSAAPTFFPLAEIPHYNYKQFIDGGVWANNPTLVGLLESLRFFVGEGKEFNSMKILSISSLSLTGGKPTGLKRNRSFIDWNKDLFETTLTGQSYFADFFMSHINNIGNIPIEYYRVPSAQISKEQENYIQLDIATQTALNLIKGKGEDVGLLEKKKPEIDSFFSTKKHSKLS